MNITTIKNTFKSLLILTLVSACSKTKYENEQLRLKTDKKIAELNELINLSDSQQSDLFDLYYKLGVETDAVKKDNSLTAQEKQNKITQLTAQSGKEMHGILTEEQFEKYRKYQSERKAILSVQIKEKFKEMQRKKSMNPDSIK